MRGEIEREFVLKSDDFREFYSFCRAERIASHGRSDRYLAHLDDNAKILECAFDDVLPLFDVTGIRLAFIFFKKGNGRRNKISKGHHSSGRVLFFFYAILLGFFSKAKKSSRLLFRLGLRFGFIFYRFNDRCGRHNFCLRRVFALVGYILFFFLEKNLFIAAKCSPRGAVSKSTKTPIAKSATSAKHVK